MAFKGYLTSPELNELAQAALSGGLLDVPRQVLLAGIPPAFVASMPHADSQLDQFTLDLVRVNAVERMAGGEIPLLILLRNAANRLRLLDRQEAEVFERALNRADSSAANVPPLPDPTQLPEVIKTEQIIDTHDPVGTPPAALGKMPWRIGAWDVTIRAALISGAFLIIAALIALIPYFLGVYSGTPQPSGSPTTPPGTSSSSTPSTTFPTGTITDPPSGATNIYKHEQLHVSGTAQNVPDGYRLDVFLQFSGTKRYYAAADPNIAAPLIDGHWSATIFIGDAKPIILWLVSLSPSEANLINIKVADQTAGYPTLPGTILASVSFTAKLATVTILRPPDGGMVSLYNSVLVNADNVGSNQQVWVVDRFHGDSKWSPQGPCTRISRAEFKCNRLQFGDPSTEPRTRFDLYTVVITTSSAVSYRRVYESGFNANHPPVTPVRKSATITVIRN